MEISRIVIRRVAAVAAVGTAALVFAAPSLASGPPYFELKNFAQEIHSTRVFMVEDLRSNELETEWQTAYAEDPNGPWNVIHSGVELAHNYNQTKVVSLGSQEYAHGEGFLLHLVPKRTYYARFFAKNVAGEVAEVVPFTTLPVARPEIPEQTEGGSPNRYEGSTFGAGALGPHSVKLSAVVESNDAQTEYSFEYSTGFGPWTVCASGSVTVAEDFAEPVAHCKGLAPETTYFARIKATNEKGTTEEVRPFVTTAAKPWVEEPQVRNVTATSAHLNGLVTPHGFKTLWHFESAPSAGGPWTPIPGAAGTISQAQAEALPSSLDYMSVEAAFPGLSPATGYYVRLFAENECAEGCGEGENPHGELISMAKQGIVEHFTTSGPPTPNTFATHSLHGETPRVIGTVNPDSTPTSEEETIAIEGAPTGGTFTLTFDGQTTTGLPYDAEAETIKQALNRLLSIVGATGEPEGQVQVTGPDGGPYTVYFERALAEKDLPPIAAGASGLTPSGSITVSVTQQGGVGYDTHYHFEYEAQTEGFTPFSHAKSMPSVDVGAGNTSKVVYTDLSGLQAGGSYRYRLVATNTSPGDPVVDGQEQTLSVPIAPSAAPAEACPNEALRTGPSASLPDCRAYEQVTPVDKEGSQEAFHYSGGTEAYVVPGEDGEHLMLDDEAVTWGAGPGAGHSPFFFSRTPSGWRMTAAATEPEFGVKQIGPQVFDPDLTRFGFESGFVTSPLVDSKTIEFRVGAPEGPYTTVTTVPRNEVGGTSAGWVAASGDFSKLILEVEDRHLVEPASTTKSGFDLYEYSGGPLRQVNVLSNGTGIGACGAIIVPDRELINGVISGGVSSPHGVSEDGSRVFFEAVPGSNCGAGSHLYMREDGTTTVDLGAVELLAANAEGTKLLLERDATHEIVGYNTETGTTKAPSAAEAAKAGELAALGIPYRVDPEGALERSRYEYFTATSVAAVPGGSPESPDPTMDEQLYRYDSIENVVECVSCASPYDPEPRFGVVVYQNRAWSDSNGSRPGSSGYSANGDYAFFSTPSALVPSDVDDEISPEPDPSLEKGEFSSSDTSASSDVYEWRRYGLNGCDHVQGCIALITNGRGGFLTYFLGTADEGHDVFFYTSSQLVEQDKDSAGDIYDARIDGGVPPPPPAPVECEGDACSNPASPPNDATPSSFTFSGSGNLVPRAPGKPAVKAKKPKPKKRKRKKGASKRLGKALRRGVARKESSAGRSGR